MTQNEIRNNSAQRSAGYKNTSSVRAVSSGTNSSRTNNSRANGGYRSSSETRERDKSNVKLGYSRVKSGDIKRRQVTRAPDMSNPKARAVAPSVAIGTLPRVQTKTQSPAVAGVYVEPKVHTVIDTTKKAFPLTTILLSVICTILMLFMIINYVKINEYTIVVSKLKSEISDLADEKKTLSAELDKKNDLELIEDIAKNELGMVKLEEIDKRYVAIDAEDSVEIIKNDNSISAHGIIQNIMSAIASLLE